MNQGIGYNLLNELVTPDLFESVIFCRGIVAMNPINF
jgi:hypothetical protein